MTKLVLCMVIAAVVLVRGLEAFEFDRQPEDEILDGWLKEQMAESQTATDSDRGFATPGHVEEHDFMTAFFENQDHEAFADATRSDGYVDDYLAEFFSHDETENNAGNDNTGVDDAYFEVFGQDTASDFDQGNEDLNGELENSPYPATSEEEEYLSDYVKNYQQDEQESKEQKVLSYAVFAKIEEDEEEDPAANTDVENDFGRQGEEGGVDRGHVENYFDTFFNQPESIQSEEESYENAAANKYLEDIGRQEEEGGVDRGKVENYFDTFSNQPESIQSEEESEEESYENAAANKYLKDFGRQEEEGGVDRGQVENFFDDFFNQPQSTSQSEDDGDDVWGNVGGGKAKSSVDGVFNIDQQEATSENQPGNDLELWLQAMEESDDFEAEEEEMGTLVNPEFDDFPEDDLFPAATVQAIGKLNPVCLVWKQKMTVAQASVNAKGKALQAKIAALQAIIKQYRNVLKISCKRDCDTICIPVSDGEECVEKVNGTCILTTPKIKECGERIRDPKCEAKEAECESGRKGIAEKVKDLKEKKDDSKNELDMLTKKLMNLMNSVPKKCLDSQAVYAEEGSEEADEDIYAL